MASLQPRKNKDGKIISYSIKIFTGRDSTGRQLKPFTATFKCKPEWTEKFALREAEKYAANLERDYREGRASDSRIKLQDYTEYVLTLKEERGIKHSTITRYRELTVRIYEKIGHMKLVDIRPKTLNDFYTYLSADGMNKKTGGKLSAKTVCEYHRLLHSIFEQALKEGLIPFNPAERAQPPKLVKKDPNYFQPTTVVKIIEALESEPLKWRCAIHLLMVTGIRRGELLALRWKNIDFKASTIFICANVLYSVDRGVYLDTPKTPKSIRLISVPRDTIELLEELRQEQLKRQAEAGVAVDFVFCQETGEKPLHPDSLGDWLTKFAKRHDLPHLNPHGFRHSMASLLISEGMDIVTVAARLGHENPSTTASIYSHIIEGKDKESSDIISSIYLKKKA